MVNKISQFIWQRNDFILILRLAAGGYSETPRALCNCGSPDLSGIASRQAAKLQRFTGVSLPLCGLA
jgi:hypothetical protein